ncbi:hypothetical protein ACFL1B_03590 [Nanoarchaeota archaeon]
MAEDEEGGLFFYEEGLGYFHTQDGGYVGLRAFVAYDDQSPEAIGLSPDDVLDQVRGGLEKFMSQMTVDQVKGFLKEKRGEGKPNLVQLAHDRGIPAYVKEVFLIDCAQTTPPVARPRLF